ncbi:MAG: hypothetical protein WDN08_10110 [Rhizomicrobium sp.]
MSVTSQSRPPVSGSSRRGKRSVREAKSAGGATTMPAQKPFAMPIGARAQPSQVFAVSRYGEWEAAGAGVAKHTASKTTPSQRHGIIGGLPRRV